MLHLLITDMMEITLPVLKDPFIRGYRIHAYLFCIVMHDHPDFYKYAISNYLCLHNKRAGVDYLDFHAENYFQSLATLFYDNSWFDHYSVDITSGAEREYIKRVVVEGLNNGYYIIHGINESQLKHTVHYGGDVCNNIEMTYGFSDLKDSFFVLDYDRHGRFGGNAVKAGDYIKAVSTATVQKKYLNFVKAKKDLKFEFEPEKAIGLLKCHVCSEPAYPDYSAYAGNLIGYKAIERTLDLSKKNGIDFIKMRIIKEHKEMVFRYFKYACNSGVAPKCFLERYAKIKEEMKNIFWCMLKDSITNAPMATVAKRVNSISRLNEAEFICITDYLKYTNR